jgi:hypothetical protein
MPPHTKLKDEEEAVASSAAPPPTVLPLTEEEYQRMKDDTVYAALDVRFKEAGEESGEATKQLR